MSMNWNITALCPHCRTKMTHSTYNTWYCDQCSWHYEYDDVRINPVNSIFAPAPAPAPEPAEPTKKKEIDFLRINRIFST